MLDLRTSELPLSPLNVGEIPADWRVVRIGDVAHKVTNGFVGKSLEHQTDCNGVLYLQGFNVRPFRIDLSNRTHVTHSFHKTQKKSSLRPGDILVVQSGHIGTCARVPDEFVEANCHALIIVDPIRETINSDFLVSYLNSEIGQRRLRGLHVGSSMLHINTSELAEYRIPLPTLQEQLEISEILCTWDDAIDAITRIVEARERQHVALTHQLVFGKRRLRNFSKSQSKRKHHWFDLPSDWQAAPIGTLAKEISKRNSDKAATEVLSCSKYDGFVRSLEYFKKQVFSVDLTGYKCIWRGDFGFPSNHVEEGSIGLQDIADIGIVSPIYTVFRFDRARIDNRYAFSVLKTSLYRHIFEVSTSASVDRRGSLRWKEFAKIEFPVPSLAEQQAISALLAESRGLIDRMKMEHDALVRQKRGLMQKLLTGEWRVKLNGDKEAAA